MTKITVTKEQVDANMKDIEVRTIVEFDKPTTHVAVRMQNGFIVREATTCVDPANYSEEIGKQICLEKIEDKIWFLLGFQLQEKVHQSKNELNATAYQMMSPDYKERFKAEYNQLKIRFERLQAMCNKWDSGLLDFTPSCPRETYADQMAYMAAYLRVLKERAAMENIKLE